MAQNWACRSVFKKDLYSQNQRKTTDTGGQKPWIVGFVRTASPVGQRGRPPADKSFPRGTVAPQRSPSARRLPQGEVQAFSRFALAYGGRPVDRKTKSGKGASLKPLGEAGDPTLAVPSWPSALRTVSRLGLPSGGACSPIWALRPLGEERKENRALGRPWPLWRLVVADDHHWRAVT